ncbi:Uncharacterized protein dnm_027150 [Desulfonema magnum]|uniref:Uncharacterized protein n=1 Tax=Desulfonema magnum TaxID=45655 RepID=A0A975BJX2_9BACT|nr:Uncharacterized protein dnm_027150 [Desulfonema magnum]
MIIHNFSEVRAGVSELSRLKMPFFVIIFYPIFSAPFPAPFDRLREWEQRALNLSKGNQSGQIKIGDSDGLTLNKPEAL